MVTLTRNQLAVLLAFYRGFDPAIKAEQQRGNYKSDLQQLVTLGLLNAHPSAGYETMMAGHKLASEA